MSRDRNIEVANTLLKGMASQRDPNEIAALFTEDLVFEIQGDEGAMP